jgi:hypothetical protein
MERKSGWTRVLEPLLTNVQPRQRLQAAMQNHFRRDAAWQLASMIRDMLTTVRTRSA